MRHRTIGRSFGEAGSGKTQFWLTGSKPVYVLSLDIGGLEGTLDQLIAEGVVNKGEVELVEYQWLPDTDGEYKQELAIELRDRITADFDYALDNARTIVFDRESDLWQVFRYAEFGSPKGNIPRDFDALNTRYGGLINKAKSYDVSLGLIQATKAVWASATQKTTKTEVWGFDRLPEMAYVNIEHKVEDGEYQMIVGKCRQNRSLQWQTMPAMDFATFGTLLVPGSEESDWL